MIIENIRSKLFDITINRESFKLHLLFDHRLKISKLKSHLIIFRYIYAAIVENTDGLIIFRHRDFLGSLFKNQFWYITVLSHNLKSHFQVY